MNSVMNTVMNPVMTHVTNSVLKSVTNRESHLLTTSGLVICGFGKYGIVLLDITKIHQNICYRLIFELQ